MSGVFIRRHFDGSVSDDARQGFSIHAELRTIAGIGQRTPFCHRFCYLQEAISKTLLSTVVAEVTVFESGTDPQRQSIKTLIRDGKRGVYDCVLIVDPSRLTRSAEGCTLIGQKLNRHGIRVYTPQGKIQLAPPHAFFYSRYHKEGENNLGPGK